MSKLGTFVWHDLNTHDLDAAVAFYGKLFGWELRSQGGWNLIINGERDQGTVMKLEASDPRPSHWLGYVTVASVDEAAARAQRNGGKLCVGPMDIPNVGRFAIIQDPQGTPISAFSYAGKPEDKPTEAPLGSVCWNELMTKDPAAAAAFYGEVFGWSTASMDMGPMGTYTLFKFAGQDVGGAMAMPPGEEHPPHWMHYFHVKDVDQSFAQATALGATGMYPPNSIPGIGRMAALRDPTGALFALFTPQVK